MLLHVQDNLGDLVLKTLEPLGMNWAVAFTVYDILAFYNTRVSAPRCFVKCGQLPAGHYSWCRAMS